jgi:hypothetical protein
MSNRAPVLSLLAGVVALLGAALWAIFGGAVLAQSYLAAWLFWAGLPIGALAVLLVLELAGSGLPTLVPALRILVLGMPLAALAFIPVLVWMGVLYPWLAGTGSLAPFGQAWMHAGLFAGRAIIYLLILSVLAVLIALGPADRPIGQRPLGALLALFVFALVTSLAAIEWFMSLDPSFASGEFGLLILSAQAATGIAAAILLGAVSANQAGARLLAGASAIWLALHFIQFLVVWSANLPREVHWYLVRDADGGTTVEYLVFIFAALLPLSLLAAPPVTLRVALPVVAAGALLAHMAEALWFITPVLRGHFALRGPDVLMLAGLGGLAVGLVLLRPAPIGVRRRRLA